MESKAVGEIAQVNHTYAYWEETYGVMNEFQLSIGESTCSAVYSATSREVGGGALFSVDELSKIAMERTASAREAVQLMGSLAVEHGFHFRIKGGAWQQLKPGVDTSWREVAEAIMRVYSTRTNGTFVQRKGWLRTASGTGVNAFKRGVDAYALTTHPGHHACDEKSRKKP